MKPGQSTVLTVRVPASLGRQLTREAKRRRQTRSTVARALLEQALGDESPVDPATEARRQSLLASRRRSERDTIAFVAASADLRGWK